MWKTVKLGDICTATQGVQILKSKQNESETFGYRRYLYISDFKHDKNLKYVEDVHPKKLVTADDIIVSNTGSQGEVYKGIEGILSNNLFKVTFDKELVDSGFLFMFLKSSLFVDFQNERTRGSTQPDMGHKNFLATPFSYPPLAEQQRIVAKLDAAFEEIDKAIATVKNSLNNAKGLINSTLGQIFLVEKENWNNTTLNDVCTVARGSSPRPIKEYFTEENGVNWIKIGDTQQDGKYVSSTKQRITEEGAKKSKFVNVGDFILTNSMSYGRPYIMAIDGCIHDGWFVLRLNGDIDAEYFYYLLSSPLVQNQFTQLAAGAVVKNISGDLVKRTKLSIPPKDRQIEIRTRIVNIERHIEHLCSIANKKISNYETLKSAILRQELKGETA